MLERLTLNICTLKRESRKAGSPERDNRTFRPLWKRVKRLSKFGQTFEPRKMTNLKSSVPSWNALTHIESLREQVLIISRLKTRFCNLINKLQSRISYQVRPIVDKSTQPLLSIFKRRHKIKQRLVFCARFSHNLAIVNIDENMAYLHWKPVVECCSKGGDVQASILVSQQSSFASRESQILLRDWFISNWLSFLQLNLSYTP